MKDGNIHLISHYSHYGDIPQAFQELSRRYPRPFDDLDAESNTVSVIREGTVLHVADMKTDPRISESDRALAHRYGFGAAMWIPLIKDDKGIGVFGITRSETELYTGKQIALVETFARQAVIAIENVRLFNELQQRNREITENLEQQTATSEILQVIASSPTDIQPVLESVAKNAARLCEANDVQIYRVDNEMLRQVAHHGPLPALQDGETIRLVRGLVTGRAVLDKRTIHIPDMRELSETEFPDSIKLFKRLGYRTAVSTPLIREGSAIGAIVVRRNEVRPFTEKQIAILQTFASQAVIAIENVRLFNELQQKNAEISEALEQQTATSDILAIIAENPTNVQPVLDAVAEKSARLSNSYDAAVVRVDRDVYRVAAHWGEVPFPQEIIDHGVRASPRYRDGPRHARSEDPPHSRPARFAARGI